MKIPITLITGFLGSGKTTLLNRILTENHGKRIAVIENEFGEIGIDNDLVIQADEEIFEMNNGCICCTVRGDLIRILGKLMRRRNKFDIILIETTGLADPTPVAQTFFLDDEMKENFRLDATITVVDAKHVSLHLDDSSECQEQIAFADIILLNKTDLVTTTELDAVEKRIRSMNRITKIHRCQNANVDIATLLDTKAFDLETKIELHPEFLTSEETPFEWGGEYHLAQGPAQLQLEPGPDSSIKLALFPIPHHGCHALDDAKKKAMILFAEKPRFIVPGNPLIATDALYQLELGQSKSTYPVTINQAGTHALFTQHGPDEFNLQIHQSGQTVESGHAHKFGGHTHEHDDEVTSVGIEEKRPLHLKKFDAWMGTLLQTKGADIFRSKGVLHAEGEPRRIVFQAVHMLFDGKPDRPWNPGEAQTRLVFIGRHLNRQELIEGFRSCLA
jgi:G3E family GTPase